MGPSTARAVPTYDGLPCFRSGGEMTHEVGCSLQWRGLENGMGSEALTLKGVRVARAEALWWLRAPSGTPAQGRRVRGEKGCCGHGESKREVADGGAHQVWTIHSSAREWRDTTGGRPKG
jgi:hypothetical protein